MENTLSKDNLKLIAKPRQSGIELLKVAAIFLIVISHVVQTLIEGPAPWGISIYGPLTNATTFTLGLLFYCGALGNLIFFSCSVWFLLDKSRTNFEKLIRMILDIFVISILWLVPILIWKQGEISSDLVLRSCFPTYFENNWYMTSYILFCLVYPLLNLFVNKISQKYHLGMTLLLFVAYFVISFFTDFPWTGTLLIWVSIYFFISYFKKYSMSVCDSTKFNVIVLVAAIVAHILIFVLTNHSCITSGGVNALNWCKRNNPFLFLIAFSSLNLMRKTKFVCKPINFVSSLTMFIYVIHENILFRQLIRPIIWNSIYQSLGYSLIFVWVALYALCLFVASIIISVIYKFTIHRLTTKISHILFGAVDKALNFATKSK